MKSFKEFLKKKVAPVIVPVLPVHGEHAHEKKEQKKKGLEEGWSPEEEERNDKFHLGKHHMDFQKDHHLSRDEFSDLNKGYKRGKNEVLGGSAPVTNSLKNYTDSSRLLNRSLVHHKSKTQASFLQTYSKFKKLKQAGSPHAYVEDPEEHGATQRNIKTQIKRLDHAMKKSKLKHDAKLLHGCGFDPDHFASQHPDRHIELPAYTSATSRHEIAKNFAARGSKNRDDDVRHTHILRIHLPKGHSAVPLLHHSEIPSEHETLLPRGMKLKISKQPYHVDHENDYDVKYKHHYWDAHPVEDK